MEWSKKEVDDYYKMIEDYDNEVIIALFKKYIPKNNSVLELGFGTGMDYLSLKEEYNITPSDFSREFVSRFNDKYGDKAICIDAITIDVEKKYNCIYSNKVLNVLNDRDMKKSFFRQSEILETGDYIFHTLWFGNEVYGSGNAYCNYIDNNRLNSMIDGLFYVVFRDIYTEIEENDSIIIVARKI